MRHPEQRAFVESDADPHEATRRQWEEWRSAGNAGLLPGWVRARDYFPLEGSPPPSVERLVDLTYWERAQR
jgi:hypothetical protein